MQTICTPITRSVVRNVQKIAKYKSNITIRPPYLHEAAIFLDVVDINKMPSPDNVPVVIVIGDAIVEKRQDIIKNLLYKAIAKDIEDKVCILPTMSSSIDEESVLNELNRICGPYKIIKEAVKQIRDNSKIEAFLYITKHDSEEVLFASV